MAYTSMKQCLLSLRSYLYKEIVGKENMEIKKYIKKTGKKSNSQTKIKKGFLLSWKRKWKPFKSYV